MSSPTDPLPEQIDYVPPPPAAMPDNGYGVPLQVIAPPPKRVPAWSAWDIVAVLVFTLVAIFVFTMIAVFVARSFPAYRHASFTELATNAMVVIGAQAAAYPIILLFISLIVRSRSDQPFAEAIRWNWPGNLAPAFVVGGAVLAIVVEGLARFLPIPKSLPMDTYFRDASSAYLMAAFGVTLAPLLEEIFFRGLLYPVLRRSIALAISFPFVGLEIGAICAAWAGHAWTPLLTILCVITVFAICAAFVALLYRPLRRATALLLLVVSTLLLLAAIRAVWVGHVWIPILTFLSIFSVFAVVASVAGLLYHQSRGMTGLAVAIVSTALAFAAIHGAQLGYAWAPVFSIFIVGVVFTVVREKTGSVASSFLMHCGYNLALFTALWLGSDHFRHLEKVAG